MPPISKSELLPPLNLLSYDGPILALVAALAVLLIILVAFPADVFNKTYEACRKEIHRFLRVRWLRKIFVAPPWLQGIAVVVTGVSLWMLLNRDEGPASAAGHGNLVAQTIALTVAIPLVMAAYTAPGEMYLCRLRQAVMSVPVPALLFAVLCGLLSHFLELTPSYVYGLFAMFVVRNPRQNPVPEAPRAHGVLFSALSLGALVVVAYYGFSTNWAAAQSGAAGWGTVLFDAICYWTIVLGAESLIFALLPIRFLDGRTLAGWSIWLWTVLQFLAGCFFWMVLHRKAAADPGAIKKSDVPEAIWLFVIFGCLALAFWGYFRWSGRPTKHLGDGDSPPPGELFRLSVAIRRYRDEVVLAGRALGLGWRWCAARSRQGVRLVRPTLRRIRRSVSQTLERVAARAAYLCLSSLARASQSVSEAASLAAAAMHDAAARSRPE